MICIYTGDADGYGNFSRYESYDVRDNMPVTRTIVRSRPKSQTFDDRPDAKGRPKSQNFDERPVAMRQKAQNYDRPRPKSQNFDYDEQSRSKGRPRSQNFDERPRSRNRTKSQNCDEWPALGRSAGSAGSEGPSGPREAQEGDERPTKVRFADDSVDSGADWVAKRASAPDVPGRTPAGRATEHPPGRTPVGRVTEHAPGRTPAGRAKEHTRSVHEHDESLLIRFNNETANTDISLQHLDFDGFSGKGDYPTPPGQQGGQKGRQRTGKRPGRGPSRGGKPADERDETKGRQGRPADSRDGRSAKPDAARPDVADDDTSTATAGGQLSEPQRSRSKKVRNCVVFVNL